MIKLVTDSTAYLPESFVRQHDIRVVPLYVHFGQEQFREGVELSNAQFYSRLAKATTLPTTSQPSAGEFLKVFQELVDAGHEVVALTLSSKLSGTWNSAMAAKEMLPEAPITVIDTLETAMALQIVVQEAVEAIAAGKTHAQIGALVDEIKSRTLVLFVVDTLEYLAKGGRIGAASALLGSVLKIKPILALKEGAIVPFEKVRSKQKAVARLVELIEEHVGGKGAQARVTVTHALAPEEGRQVSEELVRRLGCGTPLLTELGPVIGTHTGPGLIGAAAFV